MMQRARFFPRVAVPVGIAFLGSIQACSRQPGSLLVSGTGSDGYHVADRTGQKSLTGSRTTNAATELPPGTYTVVLNGSRQSVAVKAGRSTEVQAGNLLVSGTGGDGYYVADSTGEHSLTGSRNTNGAFELLPGTYTVVLNSSRQRVVISAGTKTEVQAGSILVSGTGADGYYVADSTGQRSLTGSRNTNVPFEVVPGTYTVVLNGSRQRVVVSPGAKTDVPAGAVVVSGGGADAYYVADETGQHALTGSRPANVPTELLPGTYVVRAKERRVAVQVAGGRTTRAIP